ncbi:MAG: fatty acid desaturase [Phycisphaerales bacterium]|nr:fatty acid desaturase [Phycisphaerales bacterium]
MTAGPIERSDTDRLPLPGAIVKGQIRWSYAVPILTLHLLALLAVFPWLFSWTGLILMVIGVQVFGQSINLCYHRILTHRSAVLPKWLEHLFVLVALCCMEDTPGKWVSMHRYHHKHSDHEEDPHSPLVTFLWSHVGWLIIKNPATHNIAIYRKYAPDILKDPFYMKLEKSISWFWVYIAHAALFFLAGFAIGWGTGTLMNGVQFGASLLVWGVFVRTVAVWHITWSVNSITHIQGYSNYKTDDNSRNNWLVGIIAQGEGWHNNHHHDPASASNQHRWWEIDMTYYHIKLLEKLGLATKVVPPRHRRLEERERRAKQANLHATSVEQQASDQTTP